MNLVSLDLEQLYLVFLAKVVSLLWVGLWCFSWLNMIWFSFGDWWFSSDWLFLNNRHFQPDEDSAHVRWNLKFTLRSHFDSIRVMQFHPVEPVLITASEDGTAKLWNLGTCKGDTVRGCKFTGSFLINKQLSGFTVFLLWLVFKNVLLCLVFFCLVDGI